MNTSLRRQWFLAVCACASVIVAGCASVPAPTEQMAVSKVAVSNAASAGGGEFAPVEMRGAHDKMERANRAMGKKDYAEARQLAEAAQVDARLAEKKAESAKAGKSAAVIEEDLRVLREELARKPR